MLAHGDGLQFLWDGAEIPPEELTLQLLDPALPMDTQMAKNAFYHHQLICMEFQFNGNIN